MNETDLRIHRRGLHWIASFEAAKGILVMALALGALSLMGQNYHDRGVQIVHHLGLSHHNEYSKIFLEMISSINDQNILRLAGFAALYCSLRFIEAYGLWKQRSWGRWLAIISCGLYLPFEGMRLVEVFSWLTLAITAVNVVIVVYLVYIKIKD